MHRLLEKLIQDHRNLERVLEVLSTQLDRFFAGEESDFDLKIELMDYIETFADQGHHPLEELIFGVARERAGERGEVLDRLSQQHRDLVQLTRQFRRSLENILQDGMMTRDELETQGREYIALQRQHIDLEENEVFPLLEEVLTEEDWAEVARRMPSHVDPVFETPDQVRFHHLMAYLAGEGSGAG